MPTGQFKSVYAVSSEDPNHPANNLLKIQSGKKWKTKTPGEKSAFVILQLDKPRRITGIDIGNEHSAFVMVTVGKMGYNKEDFKEILITSSLMTPIESKNSSTANRVRCFASNALVESVAEEKWELVKVICTQPFNRHVQYGLSFITVHIAEEESNALKTYSKTLIPEKPDTSRIGGLQLREESPERTASLFNRWKQAKNSPTLSAAAVIRDASNPSTLKDQSALLKPSKIQIGHKPRRDSGSDTETKVRDRNRDDLFFDKDDDVPNERLERSILEDKQRVQKEKDYAKEKTKKPDLSEVKKKPGEKRESSVERKVHKTPKNSEPGPSKKRPSTSTTPSTPPAKKAKREKSIEYRPFSKLLDGVVLVISGIQNPDRGVLRQKALDMGARYKPDWANGCTHLICAFKNTPKYNQVRGKGKIITRNWIEKCHSLKKRLPWRRYAIDDKEAEKSESEDEIYDLSLKPEPESEEETKEETKIVEQTQTTENSSSPPPSQRKDSNDDIMVVEYDQPNYLISSGTDTDEDIERIAKAKKSESNNNIPKNAPDTIQESSSPRKDLKIPKKTIVFEASTEEDETMKPSKNGGTESKQTMKFFDGLKFHLGDGLTVNDTLRVKQYIKQFKGRLIETASEADFVIANEKFDVSSEFRGEFVSPLWIFECNDMECRIPTRRYLL